MPVSLRSGTADDLPALLALYPLVFPDEDLRATVTGLLGLGADDVISLMAERDGTLVGHMLLTRCEVSGVDSPVALLGPLAVHPDHQRRKIGQTLIEHGVNQLEQAGFTRVLVLGDPAYYGRFGFAPEQAVRAPYPLPDAWAEAWQSRPLAGDTPLPADLLRVPPPWQDPALWAA